MDPGHHPQPLPRQIISSLGALLCSAKRLARACAYWGDHVLLMVMYRHGLRVSEAFGMRRDQVDLAHARVWVERLKSSLSIQHPVAGDELRAIKRYLATREDKPALVVCLGAWLCNTGILAMGSDTPKCDQH